MSDKDTLLAHGIAPYVLVDETGIAVNGTATLRQLAAKGFQPICQVDGSGLATGGSTLAQLRARGIEPACLVDETGVAADASTLDQLRKRGILAMCAVNLSGIAQNGSATVDFHRFHFYPITEPKTSLGFS